MTAPSSGASEPSPSFFDFAAEVGLTKHIGGLAATDALAELCQFAPGKHVLDVGCGVGHTACYLAQKFGCRLTGVDLLPAMVERSQQRAAHLGLASQVEFRQADAQALPFSDNLFDAVITESVTAFPADKQQAVLEYARVVKPSGFVGLNETTWLKYPPPAEIIAWASQEVGASVKPLSADEWIALLANAGLVITHSQVFPISLKDESKGILQRYGLGESLRILGRMLRLYLRSPAYRRFAKQVQKGGLTPPDLDQYFGYGLFVAQKK
jgi:SAM-dependent methyltransferase